MKVSEFYKEIDLEELEQQSGRSDYHQKTYDFISQVWEHDMQDLSKAQVNWLQRVSEEFYG